MNSRVACLTCWAIGHRTESYVSGHWWDNRGRQRNHYDSRCTRCWAGRDACYDRGVAQIPGDFWRWLRRLPRAFRTWWVGEICTDCGQLERRFGRPVGDHPDCIPF